MKIVNVLLSVTVVMFTMTACSAKDREAAPGEQPVENNTAANEEFSSEAREEPSSEADAGDAADIMTVGQWVGTDEAATYIQALNTSLDSTGATIEFAADGDILCMIFHYSEEAIGTDGSDLTDEQKETEQARLQQKYDSIKEQLEPLRDVFREAVGNPDLVVRIIYRTSNGTELFRQEL